MSGDTSPIENEKAKSLEAKPNVQIAVSAELYARATFICQRRNCTVEAVIEDLFDRFLPLPRLNEAKNRTDIAPSATRDVIRDLPWSRWTRRRPG